MNVWGFTPDYFEYSDKFFKDFLDAPETKANPKAEYLIPWVVNKLITDGTATCEVIDTTSKWFGVDIFRRPSCRCRQDTEARRRRRLSEQTFLT